MRRRTSYLGVPTVHITEDTGREVKTFCGKKVWYNASVHVSKIDDVYFPAGTEICYKCLREFDWRNAK